MDLFYHIKQPVYFRVFLAFILVQFIFSTNEVVAQTCSNIAGLEELGKLEIGSEITAKGANIFSNTIVTNSSDFSDCAGNTRPNASIFRFELDSTTVNAFEVRVEVNPTSSSSFDVFLWTILNASCDADARAFVQSSDACGINKDNAYSYDSSAETVCPNQTFLLVVSSKTEALRGTFDIKITPKFIPPTFCDGCQNGGETEVDGPYQVTDVEIVPTLTTTADGSVTINIIEGGDAPYTYSLDNGPFQNDPTFSNLNAGSYTAVVQDKNNCPITFPFVILSIDTIPPPNVKSPIVVCEGAPIPDAIATGSTIKWYSDAATTQLIAEGNSFTPTVIPDTLYVTQTISSIESDPALLIIDTKQGEVSAKIEASTLLGYAPLTVNFTTVDSAATYLWDFGDNNQAINEAPFNVYDNEGIYTVNLRVTDQDGCSSTDSLQIEVIPPLNVPTGISPNGDGVNDTWIIENIEKINGNKITVFNQWGNKVFEAENYQNDWSGDGLADGTYFFIIEFTNGLSSINGYLMVLR